MKRNPLPLDTGNWYQVRLSKALTTILVGDGRPPGPEGYYILFLKLSDDNPKLGPIQVVHSYHHMAGMFLGPEGIDALSLQEESLTDRI